MPFDQGHALIVGIGTYQESRWDAPVTVGDARELAAALADLEVAGYPDGHVTLLHDESATRANVIQALDGLAARATGSDTVLLFFSGHGVMGDDAQYYLTTHDTQFTPAGEARRDSGISETTFLEKLRAIHVNKLLVMINACLSGSVRATLGAAPAGESGAALGTPPAESLRIGVLATGEGRAVITACRATQSSWFDPSTPSATVFGRAVVDGFRGKGPDRSSPYIKLYELYDYVFATVVQGAKRLGGTQEPVLNIVEGVGPFPVALRTADDATLGPPDVTPEAPPATAEVIDAKGLLDFKYATQPLDDEEDVLGAFYGNRKQIGGQLVVTSRRILIGPLPMPLSEQIERYTSTEGRSGSFVAEFLHRYYAASRPLSIKLSDVTGVQPFAGGAFKAPGLEIRTTSADPIRFAIVATPKSIIWSSKNRTARDRAVEMIREAVRVAGADQPEGTA
jgi:hypothetical protein